MGSGGAFLGGIMSVLFGRDYWESLKQRVENSEKEVKTLKDESFAKLEKKVDDHIKNDRTPEIIAVIRSEMNGLKEDRANDSIMLQKVNNEQSRQGEALKNVADYERGLHRGIEKIREDIKELIKK